jgi:hypothetical protein
MSRTAERMAKPKLYLSLYSLHHTFHAVYGRENRLKVARDEAKFEEENKIKRERHIQVYSGRYEGTENARPAAWPSESSSSDLTFNCRQRERLGGLHCCRKQGRGRCLQNAC